jgi:hypothetical protein
MYREDFEYRSIWLMARLQMLRIKPCIELARIGGRVDGLYKVAMKTIYGFECEYSAGVDDESARKGCQTFLQAVSLLII